MTIEEALEKFEKGRQVCEAAAKPRKAEWVFVTSGGIVKPGVAVPMLFRHEAQAVSEWLYWADVYASQQVGSRVIWGDRPHWDAREFLAIDQAAMAGNMFWAGSMNVRMGCVFARLIVGSEDDVDE